jgi:hypothetical protein
MESEPSLDAGWLTEQGQVLCGPGYHSSWPRMRRQHGRRIGSQAGLCTLTTVSTSRGTMESHDTTSLSLCVCICAMGEQRLGLHIHSAVTPWIASEDPVLGVERGASWERSRDTGHSWNGLWSQADESWFPDLLRSSNFTHQGPAQKNLHWQGWLPHSRPPHSPTPNARGDWHCCIGWRMLEQFHLCPLALPNHPIRFYWRDNPPSPICQLRIFHAKLLISFSGERRSPKLGMLWVGSARRSLMGEGCWKRWARGIWAHTFCLLRGQPAGQP